MTLVGLAPWLVLLLLLVGTIGAAGTATRVLTNTLALRSTPENTGGATSVSMAVQFLGGAVVPVLVPLYLVSPVLATGAAGAVAVVGAALAALRLPPARPATG